MKVRPGTALYSLLFLIWGVGGGEEGGLASAWPPPLGLQTDRWEGDGLVTDLREAAMSHESIIRKPRSLIIPLQQGVCDRVLIRHHRLQPIRSIHVHV